MDVKLDTESAAWCGTAPRALSIWHASQLLLNIGVVRPVARTALPNDDDNTHDGHSTQVESYRIPSSNFQPCDQCHDLLGLC